MLSVYGDFEYILALTPLLQNSVVSINNLVHDSCFSSLLLQQIYGYTSALQSAL